MVGEWQQDKEVAGGAEEKFQEAEILVAKDLPVTGFPHCDLIDMGYFIHAIAKVGNVLIMSNFELHPSLELKTIHRFSQFPLLGTPTQFHFYLSWVYACLA